jgi:hypothetical protein
MSHGFGMTTRVTTCATLLMLVGIPLTGPGVASAQETGAALIAAIDSVAAEGIDAGRAAGVSIAVTLRMGASSHSNASSQT